MLDFQKNMTPVKGVKPIYRLRWVFEFNEKRSVVGQWNGASRLPRDMAAFVNKDGLKRAVIEGEEQFTWRLNRLLEIPAADYVSMEWVAAASAPVGLKGVNKATISGMIIGMTIITRNKKITVYIDGSVSERLLDDDERQFKIKEHNIGV
jgi:hypothetical protein